MTIYPAMEIRPRSGDARDASWDAQHISTPSCCTQPTAPAAAAVAAAAHSGPSPQRTIQVQQASQCSGCERCDLGHTAHQHTSMLHTTHRFCSSSSSSSSTHWPKLQRTIQVQQASQCSMNLLACCTSLTKTRVPTTEVFRNNSGDCLGLGGSLEAAGSSVGL